MFKLLHETVFSTQRKDTINAINCWLLVGVTGLNAPQRIEQQKWFNLMIFQ